MEGDVRKLEFVTDADPLDDFVGLVADDNFGDVFFDFVGGGADEGEDLSFGAAGGGGGVSDELTTGPVCGVRAGVCGCRCCAPVVFVCGELFC